jgi:hypothetical protein
MAHCGQLLRGCVNPSTRLACVVLLVSPCRCLAVALAGPGHLGYAAAHVWAPR